MATALHVLGLLLLALFCLAALVSLVFGVPGTFAIVGAAAVYAWATGFASVQWSTLGWLTLLALLAEGIEFFSGSMAAAGARPSRRVTLSALLGGIVGGLLGTPLLFGLGSLLGALLGAFAGAAVAVASEGGSASIALRTGLAAMRGRFLGFVLKTGFAVAMVIVLFATAL
jgi:uncharacterized protein